MFRTFASKSKVMRALLIGAASLTATALAGCATNIKPGEAVVSAQPKAAPTRTATEFTDSLACMDDLLLRSQYTDGIRVASQGLPDYTGRVPVGSREMLMHAIALMTKRSGAMQFVDVWG